MTRRVHPYDSQGTNIDSDRSERNSLLYSD